MNLLCLWPTKTKSVHCKQTSWVYLVFFLPLKAYYKCLHLQIKIFKDDCNWRDPNFAYPSLIWPWQLLNSLYPPGYCLSSKHKSGRLGLSRVSQIKTVQVPGLLYHSYKLWSCRTALCPWPHLPLVHFVAKWVKEIIQHSKTFLTRAFLQC